MFFFKEISGLLAGGVELNFTVKKTGDKISVSVLPKMKGAKQDDAAKIVPLIITGTAEELDRGFSSAISQPIQEATGVLSNLKAFQASTVAASGKKPEKKTPVKKEDVKQEKKYQEVGLFEGEE